MHFFQRKSDDVLNSEKISIMRYIFIGILLVMHGISVFYIPIFQLIGFLKIYKRYNRYAFYDINHIVIAFCNISCDIAFDQAAIFAII